MLRHRIISSIFIIGALGAVATWVPLPGLTLALILFALLGAWEFSALMGGAKLSDFRELSLAAPVVLLGGTFLAMHQAQYLPGHGIAGFAMAGTLWGAALLLRALFSPNAPPLSSAAATALNAAYIVTPFAFMLCLLGEWGTTDGDGRFLVIYMIAVVKVTDIGAYFTGRFLGRTKLIPRISPAKTWEGCAGGVVVAVGVSLAISQGAGGALRPDGVAIPLAHALGLGLVLSIAGILGDLIESMFKRAAGIKDSGAWIRGMGGLLDVVDSLLLASPVLYLYLHLAG